MIFITKETFDSLSEKTRKELSQLKGRLLKRPDRYPYASLLPCTPVFTNTSDIVVFVDTEQVYDMQDALDKNAEKKELKELRELKKNIDSIKAALK